MMNTLRTLSLVLLSGFVAACGSGGTNKPAGNPDMAITGGDMAGSPSPDMTKMTSNGCDLIKQDCSNKDKCTVELVQSDPNDPSTQMFVHSCLSGQTGMKMQGDKCNREGQSAMSSGTPGHDDCAPTLYCTANGLLTADKAPQKYCRKFCFKQADCKSFGDTFGCVSISSIGDFGICIPTCQLFSTTCQNGMSCSSFYRPAEDPMGGNPVFACRGAGTGKIGADCSQTGDVGCGADSLCLGDGSGAFTCAALCDDKHACADTSKKCMPVMGVNFSVCQ